MDGRIRRDDLETAVRNIRRIQTFFSAAQAGEKEGPVEQGLRRVQEILERMVGDARSIAASVGPDGSGVSADPDAVGSVCLEAAKVAGIADYLETVARWLAARVDAEPPEGAEGMALELAARLERTAEAVAALLAARPGESLEEPPRPTVPEPTPEERARREELAARIASLEPLVLDNTFENPLLKGQEGHYELTATARRLVEEFLASAGLDTSPGTLFTLNRKVARWIEAIPEGMVLLLKVGMLSGRPEVYPRYVPRPEPED